MSIRPEIQDLKILIIDAHPVYILRLESFLRGLAFCHITLAKNAPEGLERLAAENPDLVIMSGTLPQADARELCRQVRRQAAAQTKIIVQVGLSMEDDRLFFGQNGADFVLDRKEKDLVPLETAVMAAFGLLPK
ncbi:MAG: PleD family two-component system response regulator [Candidatus Omnitrophota bacterium]